MAQESLSGKIAVVTGGARGIGYAIAERLLEEGARVAFCAFRQNSVDAAVASLTASHPDSGNVLGVQADVSILADVQRFVAAVLQRFNAIDILINNAAVQTYRPLMELEPAEWERMMAINLNGAYYCMHEILPIFKQRGGGDIVNISSLSSTGAFAGGAGYVASKAGLNALSDAAMLDHRYDGVRVTEVMPGSTDTEFSGARDGGEWKVAPEDIAEVVATVLRMPRRATVSRVDVKPTQPHRKRS